MKKLIGLLSLWLIGMSYGQAASLPTNFGDCTISSPDFIAWTPTLTIDPNLAQYSELGSSTLLNATMTCDRTDNGLLDASANLNVDSALFTGNEIINTNIAGLGIKLQINVTPKFTKVDNSQVAATQCIWGQYGINQLTQHSGGTAGCFVQHRGSEVIRVTYPFSIQATLVKTSQALNDLATMTAVNVPDVTVQLYSDTHNLTSYPALDSEIQVLVNATKPTCTLSQSNYDIILPNINVNQLANINATAGEREFTIDLTDCQANAPISATFHDLNSGGDSQRGILGNTGTASAVKVQLLAKPQGQSSYQPLVLDSKTLLTYAPADGGMVSLPVQARYFRLTNGQLSGSVNSLASFTLSYD